MDNMSLGGYSPLLSNTYTDTNSSSASSLEKSLKSDYTSATEEELMQVCKQFESYFAEQIFKALQGMVPKSEESSSSAATTLSYFNDMLVQEYAKNATEAPGGGFGIAQMMYEQMKRNYSID